MSLVSCQLRAKPQTAKGIYMKGITLASTHGPGVRLDPTQVRVDLAIGAQTLISRTVRKERSHRADAAKPAPAGVV